MGGDPGVLRASGEDGRRSGDGLGVTDVDFARSFGFPLGSSLGALGPPCFPPGLSPQINMIDVAAVPCNNSNKRARCMNSDSVSGADHFAVKDGDGRTSVNPSANSRLHAARNSHQFAAPG